MAQIAPKDNYIISQTESEWQRLDHMHNGIREYIGSNITFAPAHEPKSILDLGTGSAAWAIQAARQYPDANVIALDMNPRPPREFPENLSYVQTNLLDPLPLPPASFDLVHTRLVLCHMPHWQDVLAKMAALVKPGGWFVVEDIAGRLDQATVTPEVEKFVGLWASFVAKKGVDLFMADKLEPHMRETGLFKDVHSEVVDCPFAKPASDPRVQVLAKAISDSYLKAAQHVNPEFRAAGATEEVVQAYIKGIQDPQDRSTLAFWFIWAQKA